MVQIIILDWHGGREVMTGWVNCWGAFRPTARIHAALQEFGLELDELAYGVGAQQWAEVLSEAGESTALIHRAMAELGLPLP